MYLNPLFPCLFSQRMHFEVQGPGLIQLSNCSIRSRVRLKGAPCVSGAGAVFPKERARTCMAAVTDDVQKRTGKGC